MIIDTHILIWILDNNLRKLGSVAQASLRSETIYISTVSLIEIAVKKRKGKLDAPDTIDILASLRSASSTLLDIKASHVVNMPGLELSKNADPFDLTLMTQAISEGLPLMTCDKDILQTVFPGLRLINGGL